MELKKINKEIITITNNGKTFSDGIGSFMPVTHEFADQIYLRKMIMPKGTYAEGAIHNHLHTWFLLSGKISVNNNGEVITHVAPCYAISQPGDQRQAYAHEDSIFINIHKNPTNTRNIDEIENEIISLTKEEYEQQNK